MLEMRNMLNKKLNKKGFTLAELLVVVAILAVLVAVSIPIFTGRLDEAKKSTDAANVRAAKAAAVNAYMAADAPAALDVRYIAEDGATTTAAVTTLDGYNKLEQNGFAAGDAVVQVKITPPTNVNDGSQPKIEVTWVKTTA